MIVICETWLTKNHKSEEYFPPDFVVHRKDRYNFDTNLKGGGVLIALKTSISNEMIACHSHLDIIAVRVKLNNSSILFIAVYIPHGASIEIYTEIISYIDSIVTSSVSEGDQLMVLGDFNLPDLNWFDIDGVLSPCSTDQSSQLITDYFANIATCQLNRIPNSQGKFLDLIFANDVLYSELASCEDITGCSSIYHTPLSIDIFHEKCDTTFVSNDNFYVNFRRADFISLNQFLLNSDWNFLQRGYNLNDMVGLIYERLWTGIRMFVPLAKSKPRFREPWYNDKLAQLELRRNKLHSLYKIHGRKYYTAFSSARKEFKILNWFLYNNYLLQIEEDLASNPKKFWNFINGKRKVVGFPSPMIYQSCLASQPLEICNFFAKFFESVYEPLQPLHSRFQDYGRASRFSLIKFTEDEVCDGLSHLDVKKGTGHDGIPPSLLKDCAESLSRPLAFIFNESLQTGYFPDFWKISFIRPIFKSGKRCEIENYRGVVILSAMPKFFEAMVQKFLFFHLKGFISHTQHGFYSGRSTVTNLVSFCTHLYSRIESRQQLDVVYTDFSKAFDKIDIGILINKLDKLNCQFIPVRWLISYLSDRWQYVKINDSSSRKFRATSGVPQGSHLGPLLFSIFINDVIDCFKFAHCLLYADDMKIFAPISNLSDCYKLQCDLDRFCSWSIDNKLLLNVSKCRIISFFRKRSPILQQYLLYNTAIDRVEFISDLGVVFCFDLSFTKHINSIINKAYIMLGFIKRNCKEFCDPLTLKSLYVSFVRSTLEYACQVWSPFYHCHSRRIESVQKQFVLYALRGLPSEQRSESEYMLPSYHDRCNLLSLQRLDHRRDIASAMFVCDTLNGRIDCAGLLAQFNLYAPQRCLRPRDGLISIDAVSTNYGLSQPVIKMSKIFNVIYCVFDFNKSRNSFKNDLRFISSSQN